MTNSESNIYIKSVSLNEEFSITPNALWENKKLSWKAKGLMGYLLSRPKNWKIYTWQLAEIYQGDDRGNGIESIRTMINELKEHGYIVFRKFRNEKGQWQHEYVVYPMPVSDFQKMFPERVKPVVDEPLQVKPDITTSTELTRTNKHVVVVKEKVPIRDSNQRDVFTKDDLYCYSVRLKKDWTTEEIEASWKILAKNQKPISDPHKYIEGIIKNLRLEKTKTGDKKCKPLKEVPSIQKKKSTTANEFYSENDTSDTPLARFARRNGLK